MTTPDQQFSSIFDSFQFPQSTFVDEMQSSSSFVQKPDLTTMSAHNSPIELTPHDDNFFDTSSAQNISSDHHIRQDLASLPINIGLGIPHLSNNNSINTISPSQLSGGSWNHNFMMENSDMMGSQGEMSNMNQYQIAGQFDSFQNSAPHTSPYDHQPRHELHPSASSTSISSIISHTQDQPSLYVQYGNDNQYLHSRHSSISSIAALDQVNLTTPQDSYTPGLPPKLSLQTHNLSGLGKMNRLRSQSRAIPYDKRQRSGSISERSEAEDDITSLMSATSQNTYPTPFSAMGNNLANGLDKMTLHHRRSSSNVSAFSPVKPLNPMLSRKHRSSSLLAQSKKEEEVKLRGNGIEREQTARAMLNNAAEEMRNLPSASQQDKARSAWVRKWLQLSYTLSPGHTVPRQALYASYTASSEDYGVRAINSASFGKAVRNAFAGIKTRRLGVRGNSKYHYVALRPAISIEAERLNEFGDAAGQWHVVQEDGSMGFHAHASTIEEDGEMEDVEDSDEENEEGTDFGYSNSRASNSISSLKALDTASRPPYVRRHTTSGISTPFTTVPLQPTPVYNLPDFPVLNPNSDLGPGFSNEQTHGFWNAFCRHQETLTSNVRSSNYERFDTNSRNFWVPMSPAWVSVCHHPIISRMICDAMAATYNHAIGILLERLNSPVTLVAQQSARQLARNLEGMMEDCLSGFAKEFSDSKIELSVRAAHLLQRCIDLQQLSTALLPILSRSEDVCSMLAAWENLDLQSLSDQCALSCSCHQNVVENILEEFKGWLASVGNSSSVLGGSEAPGALERLASWIDKVTVELQHGVDGMPAVSLKSLVTRAGFVTSQVMRDFTLKSESTFGLFQLLKTWIDDYVSISVLRQISLSSHSAETSTMLPTTMSVMIPSQNPLELSASDLSTAMPIHGVGGIHNSSSMAGSSGPRNTLAPLPPFNDLPMLVPGGESHPLSHDTSFAMS